MLLVQLAKWLADQCKQFCTGQLHGGDRQCCHFVCLHWPAIRFTNCSLQGHTESKERLRIQSAHLSVAADHRFLEFSVKLKSCLMQLFFGPCHVVSADCCGHGCADWESSRLWGASSYSFSAGRWDLRLSCRNGKLSREIVLLHDNARPHTALLREQFHWDIFEHPPYCPDLAPSGFYLI